MPGRWRRPGRMYLWLLGLAPAAAHLSVGSDRTVAGPALVLDHLFGLLLVAGFLALCIAVGRAALRGAGVAPDAPVDLLLFALACGAGIVSTALLVVGAVGGFRPAVLGALFGVAVVALRRELGALPAIARAAGADLARSAGATVIALSAVVVVCGIMLALAPPTDYDSLMYHLKIPALFLEQGAVHLPDDGMHVAFVGLAHLSYVPFLAAGVVAGPALLNVAFALALGVVMLRLGQRFFSDRTGRLATVLLWGSPMLLLVAVTPKVDVTLAFFLLLGHHAALCARAEPDRAPRWMLLAGATIGFATGIKFLALPYLAALAPLLAVVVMEAGATTAGRARLATNFVMAFVVAALPWLLKNWVLLGAPLYPRFAQRLLPTWLAEIYGARELPDDLTGTFRPLAEVRTAFGLRDWFLAPERLTPEADGASYRANPLFLLVVFALPMLRHRALLWVVVPMLLFFVTTLTAATAVNLRYLVPVIPLATLASAHVVSVLAARLKSRVPRAALFVLVAAIGLWWTVSVMARRLEVTRAPAHAAGILSRRDYRVWSFDVEIRSHAQVTEAVNRVLDPDDRILLLFEGRGFYFESRVLQDNLLTNWIYLRPRVSAPRCIAPARITHVLVGTSTLEYFTRRDLDPARMGWNDFEQFAERCLRRLEQAEHFTLYAVTAP